MNATATLPSLDLSISTADLTNASQLKRLIQGNAVPIFTFGAQMAPYWSAPVSRFPMATRPRSRSAEVETGKPERTSPSASQGARSANSKS